MFSALNVLREISRLIKVKRVLSPFGAKVCSEFVNCIFWGTDGSMFFYYQNFLSQKYPMIYSLLFIHVFMNSPAVFTEHHEWGGGGSPRSWRGNCSLGMGTLRYGPLHPSWDIDISTGTRYSKVLSLKIIVRYYPCWYQLSFSRLKKKSQKSSLKVYVLIIGIFSSTVLAWQLHEPSGYILWMFCAITPRKSSESVFSFLCLWLL